MNPRLPDSIRVLERGWLSANNILLFEGGQATLVDSGYVTHAAQTISLLKHALDGRPLTRLLNTHSHSDHMGGNHAVQATFGCEIAVPAGLQAHIADWDEDALLLSPLGQQASRFQHDQVLTAGDEFSAGGHNWQCLAVPGHDMEALAFYTPEKRLLISGDALWENGFGVIFPELLGTADGLASARRSLEMLGQLAIDAVIPGHGRPFAAVDLALERALLRLDHFASHIDGLAWHAIKVIVAFALLERQRIACADFAGFVLGLPFAVDVNARFLAHDPETLVDLVLRDLLRAGAVKQQDDWLVASA